MKQQRFEFDEYKARVTVTSRPWAEVTKTIHVKEEPLTHHRQVGPTCAYYALAMLTGLPPFEVLKVGSQVLKGSRLRKMNGTHDLLVETFRRLGYRFPWREISHDTPRKSKTIGPADLSGSGLIRVTPRAKSHSGHLVAYKDCIVYDSDQSGSMHATDYIAYLKRRRRYYVRIIPMAKLERHTSGLSDREERAQVFLMKRPRRPRIWRW